MIITREEIEKLSEVEPYCFETDSEERWYEIGCIDGLKAADAEPNLEMLWHDAIEEPQGEYEIVCQDTLENVWLTNRKEDMKYHQTGWLECVMCECIVRWAYIKDLLPKGGER